MIGSVATGSDSTPKLALVKGYWAETVSRGGGPVLLETAAIYEGKINGKVEQLIFFGNQDKGEPYTVHMPDDEKWKKSLPKWASLRREVIVDRMKTILNPMNFNIHEEETNWVDDQYKLYRDN